jgi:hypothetical protein
MEVLRGGDWIGQGARKFYAEMDSDILPSLQRLIAAMGEATKVTRQISDIVKQTEDEAARILDKEPGDAGNGGNSGGDTGGGGDSGGQGSSGNESFIERVLNTMAKTWKVSPFQLKTGMDMKTGQWKNDKGISAQVNVLEGSLIDEKTADGRGRLQVGGGSLGLKAGWGEKGFSLGPAGELYALKGKYEGTMVGDQDLGWTGGVNTKLLSADGFIGLRNNSFGGSIGFNVASVGVETGVNVAGVNVGVGAEVGLKFELGFQIGQETKVKLGPFSFSLNFGKAKK